MKQARTVDEGGYDPHVAYNSSAEEAIALAHDSRAIEARYREGLNSELYSGTSPAGVAALTDARPSCHL